MDAQVQKLYETGVGIDARQTEGKISLQTAEEELFEEIEIALNRGIISAEEAERLREEWRSHRRYLSDGVNRELAHQSFLRCWNVHLTHAVA